MWVWSRQQKISKGSTDQRVDVAFAKVIAKTATTTNLWAYSKLWPNDSKPKKCYCQVVAKLPAQLSLVIANAFLNIIFNIRNNAQNFLEGIFITRITSQLNSSQWVSSWQGQAMIELESDKDDLGSSYKRVHNTHAVQLYPVRIPVHDALTHGKALFLT